MDPEQPAYNACTTLPRRAARYDCCLRVPRPFEKPDLAIYSQYEELLAGREPSWDNPDIWTHALRPFALLRETTVRVYNRSPSVSAVNALVHLRLFPFGIGTTASVVATRRISLAAGASSTLRFPLEESVLAGDPRIGVTVDIEHPQDAQPINNSGSQAVDVAFTSDEGRSQILEIPVVNNATESREIRLEIIATDLNVSVAPALRVFASGETGRVALSIQVPPALHGSASSAVERRVTVVGRGPDGSLIGGVTRILEIDD